MHIEFEDLVEAINQIKMNLDSRKDLECEKNLDSRTDIEFQKYIELEKDAESRRILTYCNKIPFARSWNDVDTILNEVLRNPKAVAAGVAAMPERLRSQLTLKHWKTDVIKYEITRSQVDRHHDPYFIIPFVSTQEYLNNLPVSARQCFLCGKGFQDLQTIIWKFCQRHTMHYCCLRDEMNKDRLPLHGPCGCGGTAAPSTYFEAH